MFCNGIVLLVLAGCLLLSGCSGSQQELSAAPVTNGGAATSPTPTTSGGAATDSTPAPQPIQGPATVVLVFDMSSYMTASAGAGKKLWQVIPDWCAANLKKWLRPGDTVYAFKISPDSHSAHEELFTPSTLKGADRHDPRFLTARGVFERGLTKDNFQPPDPIPPGSAIWECLDDTANLLSDRQDSRSTPLVILFTDFHPDPIDKYHSVADHPTAQFPANTRVLPLFVPRDDLGPNWEQFRGSVAENLKSMGALAELPLDPILSQTARLDDLAPRAAVQE